MNKKVVAIVEARMASSRLPGKVLLEAGRKPLLQHLVERLRLAPSVHEVVVATTVESSDEPIVRFCKSAGVRCYRGSEHDVLQRVLDTAKDAKADIIVEITGDCPLVDPEIIDQAVRTYLANDADYVTNVHVQSYPVGMDVQVYSTDLLERVSILTSDSLDREHVTRFIRKHPERFHTIHLQAPRPLHWPELWVVLDEPADYDFVRKIIDHFGGGNRCFGTAEIVHLLREVHPEWLVPVQAVRRKGLDD